MSRPPLGPLVLAIVALVCSTVAATLAIVALVR